MRKIVKAYLKNKFFGCDDITCRVAYSKDEINELLEPILPPISMEEINNEVDNLMEKFNGKDTIDQHEFISIAMSNSYWLRASGVNLHLVQAI